MHPFSVCEEVAQICEGEMAGTSLDSAREREREREGAEKTKKRRDAAPYFTAAAEVLPAGRNPVYDPLTDKPAYAAYLADVVCLKTTCDARPAAGAAVLHRRRFAGSRGGVWADGSPCSQFQPESIWSEKRTVVKSLVAFESAHADSRYGQGAVESAKPPPPPLEIDLQVLKHLSCASHALQRQSRTAASDVNGLVTSQTA